MNKESQNQFRPTAAQIIACERELKFDRDKLNPKGGGISVGHPIGLSGTRIALTLAYEMREMGYAVGLATLCVSGGQGTAVVLATQHLAFARTVADHVAFLAGGRIPAHGPSEAFFRSPPDPDCRRFLENVLRY